VHQKENPHKPLTKVKRTREENKKKADVNFPRNAFKRKNGV
jgi:hypothetical protein